ARLQLPGVEQIVRLRPRDKEDELEAVEAIIPPYSRMIGHTPESLSLRQRYQVNLLALNRGGRSVDGRLRQIHFRLGDIVILQGRHSQLHDTLAELGCLSLTERHLAIGRPRARVWPLLILVAVMVVSALRLLPVEMAFFIAAGAVVLCGQITQREAYDAID